MFAGVLVASGDILTAGGVDLDMGEVVTRNTYVSGYFTNYTLQEMGQLTEARYSFGIEVIWSDPSTGHFIAAAFGGMSNYEEKTPVETIETYDSRAFEWTMNSATLDVPGKTLTTAIDWPEPALCDVLVLQEDGTFLGMDVGPDFDGMRSSDIMLEKNPEWLPVPTRVGK